MEGIREMLFFFFFKIRRKLLERFIGAIVLNGRSNIRCYPHRLHEANPIGIRNETICFRNLTNALTGYFLRTPFNSIPLGGNKICIVMTTNTTDLHRPKLGRTFLLNYFRYTHNSASHIYVIYVISIQLKYR